MEKFWEVHDYFTSKKVSKKFLSRKRKKNLFKRDSGSMQSAMCYMDA